MITILYSNKARGLIEKITSLVTLISIVLMNINATSIHWTTDFDNTVKITPGQISPANYPDLLDPPMDCNSHHVRVENPNNASESVEAKFCESSTAGIGSLWIKNSSTVAHIIHIRPDSGVLNLPTLAGITWGPDYWYKIADNIQLEPSDGIYITATIFGETGNEQLAATHAHISLIGELFFAGDTPSPDLSKSEEFYRYALELAENLDFDLATYLMCSDALSVGSWKEIVDCLFAVADDDEILDSIVDGLSRIGVTIGANALKTIFDGLDKAKDVIWGIGKVATYISGMSDHRQNVFINIYYPSTPGGDPPPPTCSNCNDLSAFIGDVTIPDGSVFSSGQEVTKTWRLRNTGSSTWGTGYKLVFVDGDRMNGPVSIDIPTTAPGQEINLSVSLMAPENSGHYVGRWRLRNPHGTYFGETLWVDINVAGANPGDHITLFDVTPTSPSSASSVHIVGRARYFSDFRSMRFVIGNEVHEMTNIRQVGDQNEISVDWNTASLPRGNYAILFEVAKNGDSDWAHAERQVKTYTLTGAPTPNNHPPDRPVLKSPYDWYLRDASGAAASVDLCVHPASDPDGNPVQYYFEVRDQGGGVYANSGWTSNACWSRSYNAQTYAWRVKTGDGSAESDWSTETWHFSVAGGGVYMGSHQFFSLHTNDTHFCVFVTYDGIQAPEVRAFINTDPNGTENGEWRQLDHYGPNASPDCTQPNYHGFWIRAPEYEMGTHKIKVNAVKVDSGANAAKEFYYYIPFIQPPSPNLLAPSSVTNNGTWWNTRTIHFEWSAALRAESYTLRVSTNPNPWADSSPLVDRPYPPDQQWDNVTFNQDYPRLYWSVRASNSAGSADTGPNVWFGIDTINPTCQVVNLPNITYENVFQVNWSGADNSSGVRSYDIQYMDSTRTEWMDWLLDAPAAKPYELFMGKPGHSYSFRCRAIDQAGNTPEQYSGPPYSTIRVDPSARPAEPWWNSAYAYKRNLIIQNNMPGLALPVGYPVLRQFTSGTSPTAAEIYNASQSTPKCNDLRVVYNNTTEIDRVVTECTSSSIKIWFRTQVGITAGSTNNIAHQLYYGNPAAGAPPADSNHVWYPYREADTTYLYFFQEGSGSTAYDSSGNGRNCSIHSSVEWSTSKFNKGLRFNHASSGDSRSLNCGAAIPLTAFTIEFWYKPDLDDGGKIAAELAGGGNGGGGNNWMLSSTGGRIRFDTWECPTCGSQEVTSNFSLNDPLYHGRWNLIAVSFSGGNEVKFYINGALDSTKYLQDGGINTFTPPLEIGSAEGINQIKANLGTFRISSGVKSNFPYGTFANITSEPSSEAGQVLTPPASGSPDLVVTDLNAYPNPDGGILVQATIMNAGNRETLNGFFTDVYLDHVPVGSGDYSQSVQFWVNEPIQAGQSINLTTVINDLPTLFDTQDVQAPTSEIAGVLYSQTDSTGAINEPNNTNNIFSAGTTVCFATADAFEPDDIVSSAKTYEGGQIHNFDHPDDTDWVKFNAEAGKRYTILTTDLAVSADTYLYLYGPDQTTLLASNDDAGGTLASQIDWTAPASGTYFVQVKHWNPNQGGCGNTYTLTVGNAVPVPGDANWDGHVDGVDYVIWLNHYGQTLPGGPTVGDFNSDGKVDGVDYTIWLLHYDLEPAAAAVMKSDREAASKAPSEAVALYFNPSSTVIPPETTLQVMIDSKAYQVGFLRVQLSFDPTKIRLTSEIQPTDTLGTVISKTTMSQANQTGKILLVLALSPGDTPGMGIYPLAQLPIGRMRNLLDQETSLAFVESDIEIVDLSTLVVDYVTESGAISVTGTQNEIEVYLPLITR